MFIISSEWLAVLMLPVLTVQLYSVFVTCVSAGFQVQNAFRVCPFPYQRCHSGDWNYGGDQELPGREIYSACQNEAW